VKSDEQNHQMMAAEHQVKLRHYASQVRITRQQLLAWNPCCRSRGERYDDEHLDVLFTDRAELTVADTAALPIPREDVVWLWTRPGALPEDVLRAWLEQIVTRAVSVHAQRCGVTGLEAWAQPVLSGEDRSADAAAARATWAAAWVARAAAEAATRAWAAAEAGASLAESVRRGCGSFARAAYREAQVKAEAAKKAESGRQVDDLLAIVRERGAL